MVFLPQLQDSRPAMQQDPAGIQRIDALGGQGGNVKNGIESRHHAECHMIAWILPMSLFLPAVAMMLGWGLRGFIGGGPLGAMIPGAMVALAICHVRGFSSSARICAFGAIAIGFGGDMTYGQTVGAAVAQETRVWGLLGLTLKGAVWGLLGGAVFRLGFGTLTFKHMALTSLVLSAAAWIGWRVINQPKMIYFSNRLDRPREEVWAGLLLAGLVMVAWRPETRRFAAWGALGGGLGFGLGGALQAYGIQCFGSQYPWWKGMEFTFGAILGAALARASEGDLPAGSSDAPPDPAWRQLLAGAFFSVLLFGLVYRPPLRFDFLVLGMIALTLLTLYPAASWQLGLTVAVAAALIDLAEIRNQRWHYAAAVAASLVFCLVVARFVNCAASGLLVLTWATTAIASVKFILQGNGPENVVGIAFVVMAIAVTWMIRRGPIADAP
jgi:hypothetical protein